MTALITGGGLGGLIGEAVGGAAAAKEKAKMKAVRVTAAVAETYGDSSSCAPGHITSNSSETYEPACLGVDGDDSECPVWPAQFSAPFGLYSSFPRISNASSMFYYKV